jgi:hypothetical protein
VHSLFLRILFVVIGGWKMMNRSLYEKKDYAKNRGLGDSGEAYSQGFGDSDESVLERVLSCGAVV